MNIDSELTPEAIVGSYSTSEAIGSRWAEILIERGAVSTVESFGSWH